MTAKKKVIIIITVLLIIMIVCIILCRSLLFGGEDKKRLWLKTKWEIEKEIEKSFYNNGAIHEPIWTVDAQGDPNFIMKEITGYEIYFIKDIYGKEIYFLVEFEPFGFCYGRRDIEELKPLRTRFSYYPSAYKILNIPIEERIMEDGVQAIKRGDKVISIEKEAYLGKKYYNRMGELLSWTSKEYNYDEKKWVLLQNLI